MSETTEEKVNLRVRVKLGHIEIELEGPQAFEEFRRITEEGFGKLAQAGPQPTPDPSPPALASLAMQSAGDPGAAPSGWPSLSDLALKNAAKSEREWVVVYAAYLSEVDQKKTFSRSDVWDKYKASGRHNESRQANLSENINRAVKAGCLTKIKENTYALLPGGKTEAEEIIAGSARPRKATANQKNHENNEG